MAGKEWMTMKDPFEKTAAYTGAKMPAADPGETLLSAAAAAPSASGSDYPGSVLRRGSAGPSVGVLQARLNALRAQVYPSLAFLQVDGRYGSGTEETVRRYQALVGLVPDGITGRATWDRVQADYNALPVEPADAYPGRALARGSSGPAVANKQARLARLGAFYTGIGTLSADGRYGDATAAAARRFQRQFGLTPDEVIGKATWDKIVAVDNALRQGTRTRVQTAYPGLMQRGAAGDGVRFLQDYLNRVRAAAGGSWPVLTVDGRYGSATVQAVTAFQRANGLAADGKAGRQTWDTLFAAYNRAIG